MTETVVLPRIAEGRQPAPTSWGERADRFYERWRQHVPLLFVLTAQTCIAFTLRNTAFVDEGCYLFSGHSEWVRLFGGPSPDTDYPSYFSGSPYLYPLIGAVATGVGGLTAARALSLAFMLGATIMLYRATALIFNRRAGVLAGAAFAFSGPALFMSHLATFDAPAVFLLATGLWFALRSADNKVLFLEATGAVVLAIAFKYAALVYAVPIVAITAIVAIPRVGWRWAAARGAVIGLLILSFAVALLCLAGPSTLTGLKGTTLNRPPATNTAAQVVQRSTVYVGLVLALALIGTVWFVLARRRAQPEGRPAAPVAAESWSWKVRLALATVMVGSALIAPLGDIRLHTLTSLEKHAGYGLLFAAPIAGWLLDRLSGRAVWHAIPVAAVACALGVFGAVQAHEFFGEWLNSAAYVQEFKVLTAQDPHGTHILVEDPWVLRYELGDDRSKYTWSDTYAFGYTSAEGKRLSGADAYQAAITERYFGAVLIDYQATPALDQQLDRVLATSGYQRTGVPSFDRFGRVDVEIWTRMGAGA